MVGRQGTGRRAALAKSFGAPVVLGGAELQVVFPGYALIYVAHP